MNVSPTQKHRKDYGNRKHCKQRFLRQIRMEQLERRELMAADVSLFHNNIYPHDVDGDFHISPLDALVVINELNASGPGSLAGREAPQNFNRNIDVDGDNALSPLDALSVINRLNSGEGELPPIVGVKYEFRRVNADGSAGDLLPDPINNGIPDAVIGTGERIIVRTTMRDLRNLNAGTGIPQGVFSAYHDLNYTNADNSTTDKLQLQWGEFNRLTLNQVTGGSFTLRYGNKVTGQITPVIGAFGVNAVATRTVIQSSLEGIFGVGNVRVSFVDTSSTSKPDYAINFIGSEARKDIDPEGVIDQNNLISTAEPKVTLITQTNPSPTSDDVTQAALNHNINNGTFDNGTGPTEITRYTNGPAGALFVDANNPATRTIRRMGGFSKAISPQDPTVASREEGLAVVDTLFVGAQSGLVNLQGSITPLPTGGGGGDNLGIAVFGARAVYLTASEVVLPSGTINIVDRLTASDDSFSLLEDAVATTLDVATGPGDFERFGNPYGIVQVSTPTNSGGSVIIGPGTNPKSVVFTPAQDFFGQTKFTYTTQSSLGDRATATVTIDVGPVNDAPIVVDLTYDAVEDQPSPLVIAPTEIFKAGPQNEIDPPQSQTMTLSLVTPLPPASQGNVIINAAGNLEFTPAQDFFGTVNVTVRGTDSGSGTSPNVNSKVATLAILVAPVNDPPIAKPNLNFSLNEGTSKTILVSDVFTAGPQNEISPPQSQTVSMSVISPLPPESQLKATIVSGQLVLAAQGDFFTLPNEPILVSVRGTDSGPNSPAPNANSTDIILSVTINNVNDAPIAVDDPAFSVIALGEDNTLDVLANDLAGPAGEPESILVVSVTAVTPSGAGTVRVAPGGTGVIFTPSTDPQYFGTTASFNYTIKDQPFGLPSTAKVTVTILPPASPFAVDDDYRSNSMLIINEDEGAAFDVLANDYSTGTKFLTEGDGDPVQPMIISGPGSVSNDGDEDGDFIYYTAEADRNGMVVFTYAMDDDDTEAEDNERRIATVTMMIRPVNDPPVAVDLELEDGQEDTKYVVLEEDITDGLSRGPFEDDQKLKLISAIVRSGGGSVEVKDGKLTYTPVEDYFGPVSIEYTVQDDGKDGEVDHFLTSTANLNFELKPVNDPPVFNADPVREVMENNPVSTETLIIDIADLLANDNAGPANEEQVVSFETLLGTPGPNAGEFLTSKGGLVWREGDQLKYIPAPSYNSAENRGPDTFTYKITDGQDVNQFATGSLAISVKEYNDVPEEKTSVEKRIKVDVYAGLPTQIDMRVFLAAANWSRGAPNEASQTLLLKQKVTDPDVGTVSDFGTTQFVYFAPLNTDVTTSFTFKVEDDGSTAGIGVDPKDALGIIEIRVLPFQPSSFKGTVFLDDDGDGTQDRVGGDPIEAPIGGVEVTLSYIDPLTQTMKSITEMTAADGSYDFDLLPPAEYTVSYSTPQYMVNGPNTPMSHSLKINAPGGLDTVFNFPVKGIKPEYVTYLEFLSSSYNQNDSSRRRGMHAAINSEGISDWVSYYGKPAGAAFYEVVLSTDGTKAYLTEVAANGSRVRTAELGRRDFFHMATSDGGQMVRILKDPSEFTNWVDVNRSNPTFTPRGYLDTVDDFFTQEGWDD